MEHVNSIPLIECREFLIIIIKRGRDTSAGIVTTLREKYLRICVSILGWSREVQVPILNDFLGTLDFKMRPLRYLET